MLDDIQEIRIEDFIMSLSKEIDNDILSLKEYAKKNDVPIIRDETKHILEMLIKLLKPKKILEIGTAIAYSTIIMAKASVDADIITLEDFPRRIEEAKSNITEYIKKNNKVNIQLIEKDASIYLKENQNTDEFDFVFLDAAKGQYINWLPEIKRLLKKDGMLVSDNIFKDGEIIESKFLIKKRNRTIHKRMRDFLHAICNDEELSTYIYNLGDGVSISIKK